MAVLILGGTSESRALAAALDEDGIVVTMSLAGRVPDPRPVPGELRVGGFGGPDGLADWLVAHDIEAVVDATHPFAAQMSASAITACERSGVPLLRLERPGWKPSEGDRWHWAADMHAAAAMLPGLGTRVLLTTGHEDLATFAGVGEAWFLVRCITRPPGPLPPRHTLLLERAPFTLEGELALIDEHAIDLVVTKDSGGTSAEPKLAAARERGIPVLLVRRPTLPDTDAVDGVAGARRWVHATLRGLGGVGRAR